MPQLAIYALIALGIFAAGAGSGFKVESWRWSASLVEIADAQIKETAAAEAKQNTASAALETKKEDQRVETVTVEKLVTKLVDRPVYRSCALDADGLQLANRALRGAAAAGKPDAGVPAAHAP